MMTSEQLAELIAKSPRMGDWVVVKDLLSQPLFWRPLSAGYTESLLSAGVYPEKEAREIECTGDRVNRAYQVGLSEDFQRLLQRMGYHGLGELAAIQGFAELKKVIHLLKRGDCWCEMAVGNPMATEHDKGCLAAKEILES